MASLPNVEDEKKKLREQMFEFADKVDDIVFRQEVIKKEVKFLRDVTDARRDMPLPYHKHKKKTWKVSVSHKWKHLKLGVFQQNELFFV